MTGFGNAFRPPTRRQKALGIFGSEEQDRAREKLGDPGTLREWHKAAIFPAENVIGHAIEVRAEHAFIDLPGDSLLVGLLWDQATILERQPVEIQSGGLGEAAGSAVLRVNTTRGEQLEVWIAGGDAFGGARLIPLADAARVEKEAQDRAADSSKPELPPGAAPALFGSAGTVLGVALAAALVYFVVLPLLAKKGGA